MPLSVTGYAGSVSHQRPTDRQRSQLGKTAYQDGLAAEDCVRRDYVSRGYRMLAERWRGKAGEADLIFQMANTLVVVEVKKAASVDIAASRLSMRQLHRIAHTAEEYITKGDLDAFMPIRLDLAAVDAAGRVTTVENLTLW
ncbi:MAG: YraN family protein [Pseudomonadota bacterium]